MQRLPLPLPCRIGRAAHRPTRTHDEPEREDTTVTHHELEMACRSDAGRVRAFNEDSVVVDAALGVAALADGMATVHGADIASAIATQRLLESLRAGTAATPERAMREAFARINEAIRTHACAHTATQGMATTLVSAWFRDERVSIAHVGDSRLYRFRTGQLERLTVDHSFIQEQLGAGALTRDEAQLSQSRHLVTRALGMADAVAPDLSEHEVRADDLYLLCSDGLHDLVEDADIALALETLQPDLDLVAETLVTMANDRGGADNISVALIRVKDVAARTRNRTSERRPHAPWWRRLFRRTSACTASTSCTSRI